MTVDIHIGDCRTLLAAMEPQSVHCCVTSPPYFGLRDYGVDGQLGLETTPDEYVAEMVEVFREVRRVLRDDGTLWLNLGDSYGKGKQLIGIPWRVAFALQADGWILRQDIIWHKPNPMGEGQVSDRCTKSHEYLFLLTKGERYFYDAEAIKVQASGNDDRPQQRRAKELAAQHGLTDSHIAAIRSCGATDAGKGQATQDGYGKNAVATAALAAEAKAALGGYYREFLMSEKKNRRSVWSIPVRPFKGAHFATFPPDLIEPCILAGSPSGGTVLDPFGGSGTTGLVAKQHGRNAILLELNPEYAAMARERIDAPPVVKRRKPANDNPPPVADLFSAQQ